MRKHFMRQIYGKLSRAFLLLLFVITALACNKKTEKKAICAPCPDSPVVIPTLTFKVVDKSTGNDLFFGKKAIYKPGDLHFVHLVYGRADSAFFGVDTVAQNFHLAVPTYHTTDTITMQIASLPKDLLLFETATVGKCCPARQLVKVLFNGNVVYESANPTAVAMLKK